MIKHIVIWKLKESAHGTSKEANAKIIKQKLEALAGKIEGLLAIEVGIDFSRTGQSGDIVLYSEFASREALAAYQAHPLHKAAAQYIVEAVCERRVADYEGD
jgi:hypothetical protein